MRSCQAATTSAKASLPALRSSIGRRSLLRILSLTERHSLSAHRAAQPQEALTPKHRVLQFVALLCVGILIVGGFFGYRYFAWAKALDVPPQEFVRGLMS